MGFRHGHVVSGDQYDRCPEMLSEEGIHGPLAGRLPVHFQLVDPGPQEGVAENAGASGHAVVAKERDRIDALLDAVHHAEFSAATVYQRHAGVQLSHLEIASAVMSVRDDDFGARVRETARGPRLSLASTRRARSGRQVSRE